MPGRYRAAGKIHEKRLGRLRIPKGNIRKDYSGNDRHKKCKIIFRRSYFFLGAAFLATGFFASGFFAAAFFAAAMWFPPPTGKGYIFS
jgi:hypothetical protein